MHFSFDELHLSDVIGLSVITIKITQHFDRTDKTKIHTILNVVLQTLNLWELILDGMIDRSMFWF